MTIAKQLALVLVKEIIADKQSRHVAPDYALRNEANALVRQRNRLCRFVKQRNITPIIKLKS